jgi:hypothetical protein
MRGVVSAILGKKRIRVKYSQKGVNEHTAYISTCI